MAWMERDYKYHSKVSMEDKMALELWACYELWVRLHQSRNTARTCFLLTFMSCTKYPRYKVVQWGTMGI